MLACNSVCQALTHIRTSSNSCCLLLQPESLPVGTCAHSHCCTALQMIMEDMFGQPGASNTAAMNSSQNATMPNMLPSQGMTSHSMMQPNAHPSSSNTMPDTMLPMYLMQQQALLSARQRGYFEGMRNQQRRQQLQEQQVQQQQQHLFMQQQSTLHPSTQSQWGQPPVSQQQLQFQPQLQQHTPQLQPQQGEACLWSQALDSMPAPGLDFSMGTSMSMDLGMPDGYMPSSQPTSASMPAAHSTQQRLLGSDQPQQQDTQAHSGLPQLGAFSRQYAQQQLPQNAQQARHAPPPSSAASGPKEQPSSSAVMADARNSLSFSTATPEYVADEQFVRMSAKLFNCTPAHLPHDLKQNLLGLLSCGVNSIEGYIMPGCVQLTLNAMLSPDRLVALRGIGVRKAFELLLQEGHGRAFWGNDAMLVSCRLCLSKLAVFWFLVYCQKKWCLRC